MTCFFSGGPGGVNGPPVQTGPRRDYPTNGVAWQRLREAIAKMNGTRCAQVFKDMEMPLGSLEGWGRKVDFYDGRGESAFAGVTQDYISGNGNQTLLAATGAYGDDAAILTRKNAEGMTEFLPKVVLKANWWSAGQSGYTVLHEVLHYALQGGDAALMDDFKRFGFSYKGGGSHELTQWFEKGCPDMRTPQDSLARIPRDGFGGSYNY
jgi:hypothetical protein